VAERVVDLLEAVEVDEQYAERRAGAFRAGERLVEAVAEERTVGEAREAVVERLSRQLLLELHPLGDVPRVQDDAADPAVTAEVRDVRLQAAGLAEPVGDAEDHLAGRIAFGVGRTQRGPLL